MASAKQNNSLRWERVNVLLPLGCILIDGYLELNYKWRLRAREIVQE